MVNAFRPKNESDDCPKKLNAPPCPLYGGAKPKTVPLAAGPLMDAPTEVGEMGTCETCGYWVVYNSNGDPLRARP